MCYCEQSSSGFHGQPEVSEMSLKSCGKNCEKTEVYGPDCNSLPVDLTKPEMVSGEYLINVLARKEHRK